MIYACIVWMEEEWFGAGWHSIKSLLIMSTVGEDPPSSCELTGGFGILVQCLLGVMCFLVLVCKCERLRLVKRSIERPKRLWKIFLMVRGGCG